MKKVPTSTTATRFVRTIDATGKTLEQWKLEKEQENWTTFFEEQEAKEQEARRKIKTRQDAEAYIRSKWGRS